MGVKSSLQFGGAFLSFLANIFTVLSTTTNYWTRHPGGHSGLWQECTNNICSNIPWRVGVPDSGLLLLIALTGYTVKNSWKNDIFFSWSYFSGWLALPFFILAGNPPPPGLCFLLADMIVQSTDAISGFPVCL